MVYACSVCGYRGSKWMGFCPQCRHPEPLVEEAGARRRGPVHAPEPLTLAAVGSQEVRRTSTGMAELDRVLGGGLVPGSVVLVGGEPGVGKSTLLLQMAGSLADSGSSTLIATAEESADQVGLRAARLGIGNDDVLLLADDDVDRVLAAAERSSPKVLIVDSVQTVGVGELGTAPGSVSQIRESAARIIRAAKTTGIATVLVGHVNKDGNLAGPKLLEHMVDVVLSLEGDPDRGFRALRGFKNRFGATHVVALYDMQSEGMVEVEDPSGAFLADWQADVPGTVVFPAVEGRRSVMVEIQALVSPSNLAQPRRSVRGVESARVHQILAVLERHCGIRLSDKEVFVNVVGGWRLEEPACDLAVALALASSAYDVPLQSTAAWGEVGLAGEVRAVPFSARRREEAERVGVRRMIAPGDGAAMKLVDAVKGALGAEG
jgi:DNA repair protein RadA/Sms